MPLAALRKTLVRSTVDRRLSWFATCFLRRCSSFAARRRLHWFSVAKTTPAVLPSYALPAALKSGVPAACARHSCAFARRSVTYPCGFPAARLLPVTPAFPYLHFWFTACGLRIPRLPAPAPHAVCWFPANTLPLLRVYRFATRLPIRVVTLLRSFLQFAAATTFFGLVGGLHRLRSLLRYVLVGWFVVAFAAVGCGAGSVKY